MTQIIFSNAKVSSGQEILQCFAIDQLIRMSSRCVYFDRGKRALRVRRREHIFIHSWRIWQAGPAAGDHRSGTCERAYVRLSHRFDIAVPERRTAATATHIHPDAGCYSATSFWGTLLASSGDAAAIADLSREITLVRQGHSCERGSIECTVR